jgi:hypothetical protein
MRRDGGNDTGRNRHRERDRGKETIEDREKPKKKIEVGETYREGQIVRNRVERESGEDREGDEGEGRVEETEGETPRGRHREERKERKIQGEDLERRDVGIEEI